MLLGINKEYVKNATKIESKLILTVNKFLKSGFLVTFT